MFRRGTRWLAGGAFAVSACAITAATAQPTGDRVLMHANIAENDRCAVLEIGFNYPLRVLSFFPAEMGNQLLVRVMPADGAPIDSLAKRETFFAPMSAIANIRDIEYDGTTPGGPTLTIFFADSVYFRVGQTADFQSLLVSVSRMPPDPTCTPQSHPTAAPAPRPGVPGAPGQPAMLPPGPNGAPGPEPLPPSMVATPLLDEARRALTAKDYDTAIKLLTKILEMPDNTASQEAQELIGIARERNGQLAHAKAEYEAYLKKYPTGEGADRVRQRLAALLKSALAQTPAARAAGVGGTKAGEIAAEQSRTYMRGSLSEYFYHDQMKTTVTDDISHTVIDNGFTTLQSQLVSALDGEAGIDGSGYSAKLRVSAAQQKDFLSRGRDETLIGQLYFEAATADHSLFGRVGRQYRTSGGMLGRFDGVVLSYQPFDHWRGDLIGGFPVDSSHSAFSTQRRAYGATLNYFEGPWNVDVYAMRQTDHGLLDRQPVGVEARYVDRQSSLLGLFEYDTFFNSVNVAMANGTTTIGHTILNLSLDYRRAPLLRTSDALIGQPVNTLDQLLLTYTEHEIHQLAIDRTATSESALFSVTQQFDDKYSAGLDVTLWHMSGMPASGGVMAIPSMGTEYYFAAHFIGTNLLATGDMGVATVGYSNSYNANRYTLDLNTRYPLMHDLRIGPRVFLSYRSTTGAGSSQRYTARPTIRLNWRVFSNTEFELEGGAEYEDDKFTTSSVRTWDFITNLGLRVDF